LPTPSRVPLLESATVTKKPSLSTQPSIPSCLASLPTPLLCTALYKSRWATSPDTMTLFRAGPSSYLMAPRPGSTRLWPLRFRRQPWASPYLGAMVTPATGNSLEHRAGCTTRMVADMERRIDELPGVDP
jgi:hypothetical protein